MRERLYQRLIAWKEAHTLCVMTYKITESFPRSELFGLTSQMRKSSASVPTNIAEGNARRTSKDKAKFLNIAIASLEELHYQFLLSKDLLYINEAKFSEIDSHIQRTGFLTEKLRSSLL